MASLKKKEEIESDVESIPEESEEEIDEEVEEDIKKVESEAEAEASDDAEEEEEEDEAEASETEAEASDAEGSDAEEEGEKIIKKRATKSKRAVVVNTIGSIDMLKASKKTQAVNYDEDSDEEEEEEDADDVNYLQKFDSKMRDNFILDHHPEARTHNYEEVKALTRVSRDGRGIIIDPLHKTIPILTKYEMTRVIGQRAKQLDSGAKAFVKVPLNVIDGYLIALLELEQKKLPFIIKRPFPNGGVEYWNVSDLEVLL
jgi:DNA-directed RNA polymerase subunit K/omega